MPTVTNKHKDRLFKFIFGNPEHKEWTLSLFNALNGTNYTDSEEIEFNTLEDAVYMGMKNDVSFIIAFVLNIWEHQSTVSYNIPLRISLYVAHVIEKYLIGNETYRYGRKLVKLPKPKFVCFYNGIEDQPDEEILRLSDAFDDDGTDPEIELKVRKVNINYGHNKVLMEQCRPLNEYACFVEAIRRHQKTTETLEAAVDSALYEMPEDFRLKKFLIRNKAEVKGMFLTEWDDEKARYYARKEAREDGLEEGRAEGRVQGLQEGRKEGRKEGINEDRERVASDMLKRNYPLDAIKDISKLPEAVILNLARSLGIAVI